MVDTLPHNSLVSLNCRPPVNRKEKQTPMCASGGMMGLRATSPSVVLPIDAGSVQGLTGQ